MSVAFDSSNTSNTFWEDITHRTKLRPFPPLREAWTQTNCQSIHHQSRSLWMKWTMTLGCDHSLYAVTIIQATFEHLIGSGLLFWKGKYGCSEFTEYWSATYCLWCLWFTFSVLSIELFYLSTMIVVISSSFLSASQKTPQVTPISRVTSLL